MDADIVAYQACTANQSEFFSRSNDLISLTLDFDAAKQSVLDYLDKITTQTGAGGEFVMCISDYSKNYFRKDILPSYKENRNASPLVLGLKQIKEWMEAEFDSFVRPNLEADDVMGILSTWKKYKPKYKKVIVSEDKDMVTIGGYLFNPRSDKGIRKVSQEEADQFFYQQILTGDTVDNYKGCPGVGEKTAIKLLEQANNPWETIVAEYEKKGLTEDDALVQARCARILRASDYDFKRKEVKLWTPQTQ